VTDRSHEGRYVYPFDAIAPECGQVTLEVYAEKEPGTPHVRVLEPATVQRIWADFQPHRDRLGRAAGTPPPK